MSCSAAVWDLQQTLRLNVTQEASGHCCERQRQRQCVWLDDRWGRTQHRDNSVWLFFKLTSLQRTGQQGFGWLQRRNSSAA